MKMLKTIHCNQNVITAKYQNSFELLDQILDFAQDKLMDAKGKVTSKDDPRLLYLFFLARSIKNGIAIFTLSSAGLNEDTSILLRALIEQVGYMHFIATLEDKSKAIKRFEEHEYCRVYRYRKQIKEVMPQNHQFPDDEKVEQKREEYRNEFHNSDIYWTGRNTSDVFKELITRFPNRDFSRLYLEWCSLSNYVHSSQMSFKSIVQPGFTISSAPDPSEVPNDLIWIETCFLYMLELINSEFGLHFESSLREFWDKVVKEAENIEKRSKNRNHRHI